MRAHSEDELRILSAFLIESVRSVICTTFTHSQDQLNSVSRLHGFTLRAEISSQMQEDSRTLGHWRYQDLLSRTVQARKPHTKLRTNSREIFSPFCCSKLSLVTRTYWRGPRTDMNVKRSFVGRLPSLMMGRRTQLPSNLRFAPSPVTTNSFCVVSYYRSAHSKAARP